MRRALALPAALFVVVASYAWMPEAAAQPSTATVKRNPLRDAYYGDLHLHTSYSLDAYLMGTTSVDPNEAYRFAKGEVVKYFGQFVQRRKPLDFLAVTDHSEMLGVISELEDPTSVLSRSDIGRELSSALNAATDVKGLRDMSKINHLFQGTKNTALANFLNGNVFPSAQRAESQSAWRREVEFANRNYEPGKFTTFIGYEWTSTPRYANLHRNIIFKGDSAPNPFTAIDSEKPEDLWGWLEKTRRQGYEALAIPHNGNASNGLMYDWLDSKGNPINQSYARERQLNEPLSEISQTKGSSETHPLLAPNDEFANFEIFDFLALARGQDGSLQGSYLRDALARGLVIQRTLGVNPFKYGFVGGSDWHSGLSVSSQLDYEGLIYRANVGGGKPTKGQTTTIMDGSATLAYIGITPLKTTSGNLTGVWAESNTRESIYNALRRRETFATTGTRLKFRFFGGWKLRKGLLERKNWIQTAYSGAVAMGGDLPARPHDVAAPSFAIWALKDPDSANLDRIQVIKVWEEDGKQAERVFDVAWSGQRRPDPKTGRLPAVGDSVDLKTGKYTNDIGATELEAVWKDPEFDPRRFAAYYLRVLEIPTPRWSTLLAIEHGLPLPKDVPATEQQRGWSSPIWYTPPAE